MEWRAQGTQIWRIKADTEKSHQEVLLTTNRIEEAIMENNHIFSRKWETTHDWIDHWLEEHLLLKTCMVELESFGSPTDCPSTLPRYSRGLEETVT